MCMKGCSKGKYKLRAILQGSKLIKTQEHDQHIAGEEQMKEDYVETQRDEAGSAIQSMGGAHEEQNDHEVKDMQIVEHQK
eukprot:3014347-Heterocapsa_arctica.AAC.1